MMEERWGDMDGMVGPGLPMQEPPEWRAMRMREVERWSREAVA